MATFAKASFLADKYAAFVKLSLLFLNLDNNYAQNTFTTKAPSAVSPNDKDSGVTGF